MKLLRSLCLVDNWWTAKKSKSKKENRCDVNRCPDLVYDWTEPGSNRRPKDFQSFALPAELSVLGNLILGNIGYPSTISGSWG